MDFFGLFSLVNINNFQYAINNIDKKEIINIIQYFYYVDIAINIFTVKRFFLRDKKKHFQ